MRRLRVNEEDGNVEVGSGCERFDTEPSGVLSFHMTARRLRALRYRCAGAALTHRRTHCESFLMLWKVLSALANAWAWVA